MKSLEQNKLSIVIVNYNAGDYLYDCVKSLRKDEKLLDLDIWLVDNASIDGSLARIAENFPEVKIIRNDKNIGFGAANNVALRQIKNEHILLLNPDCYASIDTLKVMLDFMQSNEDVGAATCRVKKSDGNIDWASHRGFPTPWASFLYYILGDDSSYHLTSSDMNKIHEVDSISGAFFMTRKSVLDKVGLFDEDYFLYAEDIDLCFRIKQVGYKVVYVPTVSIVHHKGISSGIKEHSKDASFAIDQDRQKALDSFYATMKIFYKKHLTHDYPFFINWLVFLGINLKWFLAKKRMSV